MHYIRRIDLRNFAELLVIPLAIAGIIIAIVVVIGSLDVHFNQQDRIAEQNFYFALQGKAVNDTGAMNLAETLRQIHNEEFNNWTKLKEFDREFVFKYEENVKAILENPETKINVEIKSWENWWLLAAQISGLVFVGALNIGYPVMTHLKDYLYDQRSFNKWWQYPWRKWWAYPMLLVMLPYVTFIQFAVAIYAASRKLKGLDRREEAQRIEREEAQRIERELQEKQKEAPVIRLARPETEIEADRLKFQSLIASINKDNPKTQEEWIKCRRLERLTFEKQQLELNIQEIRSELSSLGPKVEGCQRNLASAEARLEAVSHAIEKRTAEKKTDEELRTEFDKLLQFPLVEAVKIEEEEIKVFTGTICVSFDGQRYEIGNFLIRIGTVDEGYVIITNLCTTSDRGYNHPYQLDNHEWRLDKTCFNELTDNIKQLLREKDYPPLIVVVLQILQTAESCSAEDLEGWKKVEV